jgi:hypothetical protein
MATREQQVVGYRVPLQTIVNIMGLPILATEIIDVSSSERDLFVTSSLFTSLGPGGTTKLTTRIFNKPWSEMRTALSALGIPDPKLIQGISVDTTTLTMTFSLREV